MKMARRTVSLDEKIKKAEATVIALKGKYDAALDELEKMVAKRKQLEDKKSFRLIITVGKPLTR
jgi:hypothetical protein